MQLSDRIGRRVKLQDLNVLMTVVQAGSMGRAAERLHTSQPNISRSIADLEHALGVRLLDRQPQGVEPTECGRALLHCGVAVFDELRQGMKSIEFLTDPAAGEVRIGCNPVQAASFVPAIIDQISRLYPRIVFHVVAAQTEALHRELTERNVDLLIARKFGPIADSRLDFEFLFDEKFVVVAGSQSPWARRRRIALAELVNESWTLPPSQNVIASIVVEAFRASRLDHPRIAVVAIAPDVRMRLVATGRFLTILPASALRFSARHSDIKVLPVQLPKASVPNGIVTLKNRTLSPVARLFIDWVREVAKQLKGK
jgi:DNA-binding transcriptional LysR family regulator